METRERGKKTCKHRGTYEFNLEWDLNQVSRSQADPAMVAATLKGSAGFRMTNSSNDCSGFVRTSRRPYHQREVALMSLSWFSEVSTFLFFRLSFPCLSPSLGSPGGEKLNQLLLMSKQLSQKGGHAFPPAKKTHVTHIFSSSDRLCTWLMNFSIFQCLLKRASLQPLPPF